MPRVDIDCGAATTVAASSTASLIALAANVMASKVPVTTSGAGSGSRCSAITTGPRTPGSAMMNSAGNGRNNEPSCAGCVTRRRGTAAVSATNQTCAVATTPITSE
jgi:hypothetical protein